MKVRDLLFAPYAHKSGTLSRLLLAPLSRPGVGLALLAGVSAILAAPFFAPDVVSDWVGRDARLRMDFSVRSLFPKDDPRLEIYDSFLGDFGPDDDTALVVIQSERMLSHSKLARIHRITEGLKALPGVDEDRVLSLSHLPLLELREQQILSQPLFDPAVGADGWDEKAVADRVLDHPLFKDQIVSGDGTIAAFLVPLDPKEDTLAARTEFATQVREYISGQIETGEEVHFDGVIMTREEGRRMMRQDAAVYYLVALGMLLLILGVVFRGVTGALVSVAVVFLSAIWTLGAMAWAQIPLNLISTAIPVLLSVAGVGDTVHLLARCRALVAEGGDRVDAIRESVVEVGPACLLTSITTAAGFASLAVSDVTVVREFGLPVAFGILAAFVITFVLVPPLLMWLPALSRLPKDYVPRGRRITEAIARLVTARPGALLGVTLVLVVAAGFLVPRVKIESKMLGDFGPESSLMRTRTFMEERFGGVSALELVIRGPEERVLDLDVLQAIDELQNELRSEAFQGTGVLNVMGLTDYLKEAHHVLKAREEGTRVLPPIGSVVSNYLRLFKPKEDGVGTDQTSGFLTHERDALHVRVRVKNLVTPAFFSLVDKVEAAAKRHLPDDVRFEVTGGVLMGQAVHQSLVRNLFVSFLIAFSVVFLSVLVFSRSLRLALLSLVPNLLPLLFIFAFMALFDYPLRLVTSMIFCVVFGIAVDDTIHFVAAVHQRRHLGSETRAVMSALSEVGPALLYTSIVLVAGFSILLLSSIQGNRIFGGFCALTLVFAVAADLFLLPALILWLDRVRKRNRAELDPDPTAPAA